MPSEDDNFVACWVLMLMRERGSTFLAMGHNYNAVQVTGCHCSLELLGAWDRANISCKNTIKVYILGQQLEFRPGG